MKALIVTNNSADAKGLLPPPSCQQQGSDKVTCTNPALGISGVVFQTYPSLNALYNAYLAKITSLNSGKFKENFNDCQSQVTYGEVAWNRQLQHPKTYTIAQMANGGLSDDKAAGRVFCNYTKGNEYMVWTQNDGHLLGVVAGPVNSDVWNWWVPIHHNIDLSSTSASSSPPDTAAMTTLGSDLAQSASVRLTVQPAIDAVEGCSESPASGEATLQQAINTRQAILNGLQALSVTGLPNGGQLVSNLTTAMQDTIQADKDYQSWMQDFASSGSPCGSDQNQDSNYVAGQNASAAAAVAKNAFVAIWDPMAPRYGQQIFTSTDF